MALYEPYKGYLDMLFAHTPKKDIDSFLFLYDFLKFDAADAKHIYIPVFKPRTKV